MLMRGKPAMSVARILQQAPPDGWGLFQKMSEKTLTRQLTRLRIHAAEGAYGPEVAKLIAAGATPQVRLLENVSTPVIARLEEMAQIQRDRVMKLVEKEEKWNTTMPIMNDVLESYRKMLLDLQKVRFDLGLDEFKGPVGVTTVRGAAQTTTLPDGTSIQKQVFEAITMVDQIFDARKIPRIVEAR
jgi:hypothetical protein